MPMKQNYIFIPSFVFTAMKRSLTKAQCGEVIASVADCVYSNDDVPSASIIKGSDKYAFHSIVLEATKMQSASSHASRSKSANGLRLPLMNILAMHDNLNNSDLAEVVFRAADFADGKSVEPLAKSTAIAAHYSMLVRSMNVGASDNSAKTAKTDKKSKTFTKRKSANLSDIAVPAEGADSDEYAEIANSAENAKSEESEKIAGTVDVQENDSSWDVATDVETDAIASFPTFEQLCTKFGGSDNADFLAKSKDLWEGLTSGEKHNAYAFVESYLSRADARHYLYQYLSSKPWQAE